MTAVGRQRGKTGAKHNIYHTTRTETDLRRQLARFAAACELINTGVFMPCNSEEWCCSPDWCQFFNMCPYGGGRI